VVALIAFSVMLGSLPTANRRGRLVIAVTWAAVTIGLASTWALSDHAGTGIQVPLAVPSDIIHLTAIAVWMGGLVTLVTIVLRRPAPPADARKSERRRYQAATAEAARAVSRFSPIALGCVSTIVATGIYQAWRGVGSWGALFETTYGRLLLVKIVAVCALVALGNLARQRVQRLRAPVAAIVAAKASPVREAAPANLVTLKAGARAWANHSLRPRRTDTRTGADGADDADESAQLNADQAAVTLTRLRWSVSIEVGIVAAVLAVTAVLVNTPTARETYRPPTTATAAFDTAGPQGTGKVSVVVTPARLGPNVFRVSVTNVNGQPYRPQQIAVVLALPERNLGPLPVQLTTEGLGTYLSAPVIVTITGQWSLRITIRSDAFDETTVTIPVAVH
jgi:copper transport protein